MISYCCTGTNDDIFLHLLGIGILFYLACNNSFLPKNIIFESNELIDAIEIDTIILKFIKIGYKKRESFYRS